VTRDSAVDRAHWEASDDASTRFFVQANPGYVNGHGLLTLVPISTPGILRAMTRCSGRRAKKRIETALGAFHALLTLPAAP
jgi:hypothetical protein